MTGECKYELPGFSAVSRLKMCQILGSEYVRVLVIAVIFSSGAGFHAWPRPKMLVKFVFRLV